MLARPGQGRAEGQRTGSQTAPGGTSPRDSQQGPGIGRGAGAQVMLGFLPRTWCSF